MKKAYSFIAALVIGLLCVAPPEFFDEISTFAKSLGASDPSIKSDYVIPVFVNSFFWLYLVVASGLMGFFMIFGTKLHWTLKALLGYLFVGCFFSQIPYFSFNAYIMVAVTMGFFLILQECDFEIILSMLEAVFWVEVILATMHLTGHDTLMNFGRQEPLFFGTITQHMRFGSLLCILSPFVLLRNKLYLVPIVALIVLTTSSGFAVSIAAGLAVYAFVRMDGKGASILGFAILAVTIYALTIGRDSFAVAIREGRLPVWWVCLKTWALDTRGAVGAPDTFGINQTGPADWKAIFFGHGLDTFYNLFPAYKHDPAPFPQAHNDWIQILWETGLVGLSLFVGFCIHLFEQLYRRGANILIGGLTVIGVDMIFHFPSRMTQTMFLMVLFAAIATRGIKNESDDTLLGA